MAKNQKEFAAAKLDSRAAGARTEKYVLRLFIAGTTARSNRAVTNIRNICERNLQGRYDLEVVDIYQKPALARGEQIIAAPTLVKRQPVPLRRFIGDLSATEKILAGLDLAPGPAI